MLTRLSYTFSRENIEIKNLVAGAVSLAILFNYSYEPPPAVSLSVAALLGLGYDYLCVRKNCPRLLSVKGIELTSSFIEAKVAKAVSSLCSVAAQFQLLRERSHGVFCIVTSSLFIGIWTLSNFISAFSFLGLSSITFVLSSDSDVDRLTEIFCNGVLRVEECLSQNASSRTAYSPMLDSFVPDMNDQALAILSEVSSVQQALLLDETTELLPKLDLVDSGDSSETEEFNLEPTHFRSTPSTSDESVDIVPAVRHMEVGGTRSNQDSLQRWVVQRRGSPDQSEDTDDLNTSDIMTDSYEIVSDEDFPSL